jgi:hypothetical protein
MLGESKFAWAGRVVRTAVLCCLALASLPAAADWHITDFHSTVNIDRQGRTNVSERITVEFAGTYHGIYRDIPLDYPGAQRGTNYHLFLRITGVTDGEGHRLKYESSIRNGSRHLKIYVPGAVDTTRTVEIDYTSPNAVRFFPEYDEFYWNVTGNDWPVPIDHASAFVPPATKLLPRFAAPTRSSKPPARSPCAAASPWIYTSPRAFCRNPARCGGRDSSWPAIPLPCSRPGHLW